MARKYNPFLANVVQNYRDLAVKHGLDTSTFTNEQIFDMIEECNASTGEEQQEYFIDLLKEKLNKKD